MREETGLQLTDAQFLGHSVLQWEEHWLYRMNVPSSIQPLSITRDRGMLLVLGH
ncbi:hypothetical protein [Pseudomonas putida]|uniref:hypothetical protein n=1 Tax=Pseudomonas putida TaxID=303 RepID=UPI0039B6FA7A